MVDTTDFPDSDAFHAPQRFEADVFDCEVTGTIPAELDGAFIRIGGEWAFPPKLPHDSPFNQDGYVSRFRIRNGKCSYRGRWIRTRRFENNLAAGRQLYGCYRNAFTDDPSVRDVERPELRSVANTAPLAHAGKLFALKEDGLPHEIDPVTLQTRGTWDFAGKYRSATFTAHPKVDPRTGELVCYGYEATGPASDDLWLYFVSAAGHVRRELKLKVPYVSMLHDIALTENYVIFPVFPYVTSLGRLQEGKVHWAWDRHGPTYYGVLPREGEAKDIRWFKGPARAIVHTINAFEESGRIILDAPIFDGNPFPFFPALDGASWDPQLARAFVRRVTIDPKAKHDGYGEEILFPNCSVVDLVRIDDRSTSFPYRYMFTSFNDGARQFDWAKAGEIRRTIANCYGRFDMRSRRLDAYFAGPTHSLQEVEFVPRHAAAAEGDGFLIGVANNFAERRSELIIADAQDLGAGDLARIILPFRSNGQVHGRWYDSAKLPQLASETT